MALSDAACRAAKPGPKLKKLSDAGGLQLWVQPSGTRLWRVAYRYMGKQKLLSIGVYPLFSLAQARNIRDEAHRQLAAGIDPSQAKRDERARRENPDDTFKSVGLEFVAKIKREGRATATIVKKEWLLDFAYPSLGEKKCAEIKPIDVLRVLQDLETRGCHESARRLRSTVGAVIRYAIATARAEFDPTASLRGALTAPTVTPRSAITDAKKFGGLLRAIYGFEGHESTKAGLKLMAILFPRPGELRTAEWSEFDFDKDVWTIPATKTKMRREHRIYLPPQAGAILKEQRKISGGGRLVFPGLKTVETPISENTLNGALRRLGFTQEEMTSHGFRASASTLLNLSGKWNPDAIERQLAHVEANQTRGAYARGDFWDERVKMMRWWADYLDQLRVGASVSRLRSVR
ncbi:MAG TPA: integrase arm-type DNA-binding domain-containing protein [Rhizomicrobium sp.]|nr:integrase arm-type DNA-binding domain-containing protein [Rhizomicrobium sp.]